VGKGHANWFTGQMLGGDFIVRVEEATPATCQKITVMFRALDGAPGTAPLAPPMSEVAGQWTVVDEGRDGNPRREECRASTRWRLGDTPGDQRLLAQIKRDPAHLVDTTVLGQVALWHAVAHAPPSFIAGFSYSFSPPAGTLVDRAVNERGQPWFGV
jgi:hypothetical protein